MRNDIWITIKDHFAVNIHTTDEGIVCDIYKKGKEDEGVIASTYAFDSEVTD